MKTILVFGVNHELKNQDAYTKFDAGNHMRQRSLWHRLMFLKKIVNIRLSIAYNRINFQNVEQVSLHH